jgi:hypothetical protein
MLLSRLAAMTDELTMLQLGGYRTSQVCKMTGATYRMLDHWTSHGVIIPSILDTEGSGNYRLYSEEDIEDVRKVLKMRQVGVSLTFIKEHGPTKARDLILKALL